MYYVSSKNDDKYGITDTTDGVEEFYTKEQVLKFAKSLEIDGVDSEGTVCIVKKKEETVRLFKQGKVHLALSTMSTENSTFGIRLKSKPTGGEMSFVRNQILNVSRSGANYFSYDLGSSKSYRSGLTLDDIMMVFESVSSWTIVDCISGRC